MSLADEASDSPQPTPWWVWGWLAIIVAAGAATRQADLGSELWLDELHTAWVVGEEFAHVAPRARIGNQSPVPYWMLWGWTRLAGQSEWSLRFPSLAFSTASIVVAFWLARRWSGLPGVALVAALALATEYYSAVFYGGEARVYAWLQLLALLQLLTFEHVLRTGDWKWRVACVVLSWLLIYSHYTTAILLVTEALAWSLLFSSHTPPRYRPAQVGLDAALFALGALPLLAHVQEIFAQRGNWALFVARPAPKALWTEIPLPEALLAALALVALAGGWRYYQNQAPRWRPLPAHVTCLALLWLLGPLWISWTLSYFDVARVFLPRYLIYVFPAAGVCLALLIASVPSPRLRGAIALAVAACCLVWGELPPPLSHRESLRLEHWRGAMEHLNARDWRPGEPLFLASGLIEAEGVEDADQLAAPLREYLMFPLHGLYPLEAPDVVEIPLPFRRPGRLSQPHRQWALAALERHQRVVFVLRGNALGAERLLRDLRQSLRPSVRSANIEAFGGVWVVELRSTEPAP